MRKLLASILFMLALPATAHANTYYIDHAAGNNANAGTKVSPWQSHPYMQANVTCRSNNNVAPSYSHVAGDQFIFKGGVTWPAACFEINALAGGSSSVNDYYGVDKTWFSGSSWTRPIFDSQQVKPVGDHFFLLDNAKFTTVDNIEMKNQDVGNSFNSGVSEAIRALPGGSIAPTGIIVENVYIHDWMTNSTISNATGAPWYSAGGLVGYLTLLNSIVDDTNGFGFNSNGQKVLGGNLGGGCQNCREVGNSKFVDTVAVCFEVQICHDTEITGINQSIPGNGGAASSTSYGLLDSSGLRPHTQAVEDENGNFGGFVVYNNWIHDNFAGLNIFVGYNGSAVFNNVMARNTNNAPIIMTAMAGASTARGYIDNNTIDCGGSGQTAIVTEPWSGVNGISGAIFGQNNLLISCSSGTVNTITGSVTFANNYAMSASEATSFGFTAANKYSPSSSDSNVAKAGANLTSVCSVYGPLCQDASGASWFGGSANARPTSGNWDIGAYQFSGGGGGGTSFISLSASTLNFGSVTVGQSSSVQLSTLTNTGTAAATFNSDSITGQFAFGGAGTCNNPGGTLAAGATCTYSAKFVPTSVGPQTGAITINDTATNTPQTISLTGTGVATAVTFTPASNNYGSINQGSSSAPVTFTLTNTSGVSMTIISVSDVGGNAADFPITNALCTGVITAGNGCSFTVTFSPQASGARSTTLTVSYSGGDNAGSKTSALSGTGVQVVVTTPTIFPPFGSFARLTTVTLSDSTAGAAICYTLDGTPPQTNGAGSCVLPTLTYTGPIQLVNTTVVQAVGTKATLTDSSVASATIVVIIPAVTPAMMTQLPPQLPTTAISSSTLLSIASRRISR